MAFAQLVDAHAHLGPCRVFDVEVTEEVLLSTLDKNGVNKAVVQPFPGCPDPAAVHNEIAELADRYPGRIFGIASVNPHQPRDNYRREIKRCIEELGFVGVKLHTIGHAVNPPARDGMMVAETAAELGVPMMVHTGTGAPFALPSSVAPLARNFPGLNIVLAHAGGGIYTADALAVAQQFSNVYLELSWCQVGDIRRLYQGLGSDRLMFGSDMPFNLPVELAKWHVVGLPEEDLLAVLYSNAVKIFRLTEK